MFRRDSRKNVIFLTIDALSYSRLGFAGCEPSPSPTLDRVMGSGWCFTNTFAAGCPTMFATPAIFTSTLPLDRGGYGLGIRNREASFVEVLKAAGYSTAGFCSGLYQGRLFGYDRGFDEYYSLFDLHLWTKVIRGLFLDYLTSMRQGGALSFDDCVVMLEPFLAEFFAALRQFCREKDEESRGGRIIASPVLHAHCFESVEAVARVAEREFLISPTAYTTRLLQQCEEECVLDILPTVGRAHGRTARMDRADALLAKHSLGATQPVVGPSGAYVMSNLLRWLDARDGSTPFFAWAHLMDCHDLNYTSYDIAGAGSPIGGEVRAAKRLRDAITRRRGPEAGNVHYDLSIRYADRQLHRLLEFLEARGLLGDTLLVVYSDHGGWKNGHPRRPAGTDYMSFYDEMYHIPLVLLHPDLETRTANALCSALDVGPTLLDLLDLSVPASFRGQVAHSPSWPGRDFVMMEHMASGPCDFHSKNIHLCLRSNTHKIVCEIPPIWTQQDGALRELYDLENDPLEQTNLAGAIPFPERLGPLVAAAEARVRELFEFNYPGLPWLMQPSDPEMVGCGER